jgi:hypothetical protein
MLKEIIPISSTMAVIWNPTNPAVRLAFQEAQDAAPLLGIRLVSNEVRTASDITSAFESRNRKAPERG